MKKLTALVAIYSFFTTSVTAFAQNLDITVSQNGNGISSGTSFGTVLSNIVKILFIAGGIIALFMIIIGAIQWITSGGDKESVGKARGRITEGLIGLVVLGLAFVIVRVVGNLVNVNIMGGATLPVLSTP